MLDYRLTRDEQELTLTVCRADDDVRVYTSDRLYMRKLDKLCETFPDVYKCSWVDGQVLGDSLPMGKRYTFPRKYLRFAAPPSEAQRAAARANAVKMRSASQIQPTGKGF